MRRLGIGLGGAGGFQGAGHVLVLDPEVATGAFSTIIH